MHNSLLCLKFILYHQDPWYNKSFLFKLPSNNIFFHFYIALNVSFITFLHLSSVSEVYVSPAILVFNTALHNFNNCSFIIYNSVGWVHIHFLKKKKVCYSLFLQMKFTMYLSGSRKCFSKS